MTPLLKFTVTTLLARTSAAYSAGFKFEIAAMLLPTAALAESPLPKQTHQPQAVIAAMDRKTSSLKTPGKLPARESVTEAPELAVGLLPPIWSLDADLAQERDPIEQAQGSPQAPHPILALETSVTESFIPLDEALSTEAILLAAPSLRFADGAIAQESGEDTATEIEVEEATESDISSEDNDSTESLSSNFIIKPQVDFSRTILDWQETVTGKPKVILEMGEAGIIPETGIVLSGAYWASQMYEYSNTAGKFPILSRFPSQHNNRSKSGEQFIINNAALGITGRLGDWGTVYLQPEYTEIEFPGQEEWQWRKAFVMVGNLDKFPLYAYYGRNTVDFGWMDGYNPFTHSVNNHFYRVDSDEAVLGLGYAQGGLHVIGTAIPSGRHLRVADTSNSDGWDNFSVNASYDIPLGQSADLTLGGGYLHSTIYNRVIAHHPGPTFAQALANGDEPKRNGAYDLFAELQWEDLRAGVEYTSSLKKWPATDAKVQALTVQGAYDFDIGDVPLTLSAVYGLGLQGPDDEEYERLSQLAIGLEADIADYVTFAFEYVRNDGFVPLVAITRASDRDVTTNTYIFGMKLRF